LALYVLLAGFVGNVHADTLLHSITGYTSTDNGIVKFSALAFNDAGRIIATGNEELLVEFADARQVDGRNQFVLPGLHDAHAHVSSQGLLNIELNLTGSASLEEAVSRIADYKQGQPRIRLDSGTWLEPGALASQGISDRCRH
jgi:predicted amidohydrolase YtcJ